MGSCSSSSRRRHDRPLRFPPVTYACRACATTGRPALCGASSRGRWVRRSAKRFARLLVRPTKSRLFTHLPHGTSLVEVSLSALVRGDELLLVLGTRDVSSRCTIVGDRLGVGVLLARRSRLSGVGVRIGLRHSSSVRILSLLMTRCFVAHRKVTKKSARSRSDTLGRCRGYELMPATLNEYSL